MQKRFDSLVTHFSLRNAFVIFVITATYSFGLSIPSRSGQAVLLGVHGIACMICGGIVWYLSGSSKVRVALLPIVFLTWGMGELGWAYSYFWRDLQSRLALVVILTELLYSLSFFTAALSLFAALSKECQKQLPSSPVAGVALLIAAPVALRLVLQPFLHHGDEAIFTLFNAGEVAAMSSSFALLFLSVVVIVCSSELAWSAVGAGFMCLVFGDWAIRVDKVIGHKPDVVLYSFLVLFGIYTAFYAYLGARRKERILPFNRKSILSSFKLGTVLVVFLSLIFYCVFKKGDLESIKILCLGCSVGTFLSVLLIHLLMERITKTTERLGQILSSESKQETPLLGNPEVADLPTEFQYMYQSVFSRMLWERHLLEEQLIANRITETQHQVAHDIRSPLTALAATAEHLEALPEEASNLVKAAIARIQEIANGLLRAGNTEVIEKGNLTSIAICELIKEVISQKQLEFRSLNKVEDFVPPPNEEEHQIFCDGGQLRRVLSNLINNGVEATKHIGAVRIELQRIEGYMQIAVIDSGVGIPQDICSQLTKKWFSYGKPEGVGLGLYFARKTVESWNGKFEIKSSVGTGTIVTLLIPSA